MEENDHFNTVSDSLKMTVGYPPSYVHPVALIAPFVKVPLMVLRISMVCKPGIMT